jgi:hypothetical protein
MLCVVCLMLFGSAFPKVYVSWGHCLFDALGLALFSECKDGCVVQRTWMLWKKTLKNFWSVIRMQQLHTHLVFTIHYMFSKSNALLQGQFLH